MIWFSSDKVPAAIIEGNIVWIATLVLPLELEVSIC
jgi:hypothetical protein